MECVNRCIENGFDDHTINCELGGTGEFTNEHIGQFATERDAVREYAHNVGAERLDNQWILSPYDTWERNPHYFGPEQPHPESD